MRRILYCANQNARSLLSATYSTREDNSIRTIVTEHVVYIGLEIMTEFFLLKKKKKQK